METYLVNVKWMVLVLVMGAAPTMAELQLNDLFKDNMVLQRDAAVSVYGRAPAGNRVTVEFNGQRKTAEADPSGGWELKLDPMGKSFAPRFLQVTSEGSEESVSIQNVLIGDVWLCSGQSNMALGFGHYTLLAEEASTIHDAHIRSVILERRSAGRPEESVVMKPPFADAWREARTPWVNPLSPTAYFFAAKLRRDLDVPVGLLISAAGGTQIQRWMPTEAVEQLDLDAESSDGAGALYNAMIHPLRKFTLKGVIWYQGESNGRIAHSYYALSIEHIKSWRAIWARNNPHLDEMPFYTVQIAPFRTSVDGLAPDAWAYVRDAQLKTLEMPNTGLVVTTDLGERQDIHPQRKQLVGERLALWAEQREAGIGTVSGPLFKDAVLDGNRIWVHFSHVGSGLEARRVAMSSKRNVWAADDPDAIVVNEHALAGFVICGDDRIFVPAEARIVGDAIEIWSDEVPKPIAVRYGWSTFPLCNLYNKEGLPASPFRSDEFAVPDVQGRLVGEVWDRDESKLGPRTEFTGTNPETAWDAVEHDGLKGHRPAKGQTRKPVYAYYKVTDGSFRAGSRPECVVSIVYLDNHTGTVQLQYDSSDPTVTETADHPGAWKSAAKIIQQKSGKWKVLEIPISDAFFNGRCNGADIRVSSNDEILLGGVYCR